MKKLASLIRKTDRRRFFSFPLFDVNEMEKISLQIRISLGKLKTGNDLKLYLSFPSKKIFPSRVSNDRLTKKK